MLDLPQPPSPQMVMVMREGSSVDMVVVVGGGWWEVCARRRVKRERNAFSLSSVLCMTVA